MIAIDESVRKTKPRARSEDEIGDYEERIGPILRELDLPDVNSLGGKRNVIVWIRKDLRLHDNPALV